ncbi:putative stress response protein, TerZ- and CABP1 [Thiovulum sp. ES]|nr:putative stress response protein, TerZ- and CABP1 [Thiovulum sp. ES]
MAISLVKGQKISLEKESGKPLSSIFLGLNWGAIEKKTLFGTGKVSVDLDGSCATFDENGNRLDVIYFGNLKSKDGSIQHSGDDLTGDTDGDDGIDNEIIGVDLSRLNSSVSQIVFVLNSFKGQDFATIPFARIRIFEGSFKSPTNIIASFDIANDPKFAGFVSMIMGKLYKKNGEWKFSAIGEPTKDKKLQETIETIQSSYL